MGVVTLAKTKKQENVINVNEMIILKVDVRVDTQDLDRTLMRDNEGCAGL